MKRNVLYTVLFALALGAFVYLGNQEYSDSSLVKDSVSKYYEGVPETDLFVSVSSKEVVQLLENGSGYLVIGYPSNPWMQKWMELIYLSAGATDIEKIYYYDSLQDSRYLTKEYQEILETLGSYTRQFDQSDSYLMSPLLLKVVDGEIVYYNDETALLPSGISVEEYWDESQIQMFLVELYQVMHANEVVSDEEI